MKYLKTYKSINESKIDLSFEDFQDILIGISDESDFSKFNIEDKFYEFITKHKIPDFFIDEETYFDVIGFGKTGLTVVNEQINDISKLISNINEIENNVVDKLLKFSCKELQIGLYKSGKNINLVLQYIF